MDPDVLQDLERRLRALEVSSVRLRIGEVTDVAPLDVDLGGSGVSHEDVRSLGPLADNDVVAALMWGNDILVLGALDRPIRLGTAQVTFPGGSQHSTGLTINHGLGVTPSTIQLTGIGHSHVCWASASANSTSFVANISTRDESSPAAATTAFLYWLAIG